MKILPTPPKCPKCDTQMMLRHKKGDESSKFWGCPKFPRCNGTRSFTSAGAYAEATVKQTLRRILSPSDYQKNIFDWLINGSGNAMVNAVAGSGKTTVLEHLCSLILETNPTALIVVLMYNSHIQKAAAQRGMPAQTTHSLGLAAVKQYVVSKGLFSSIDRIPQTFVDGDKVNNIVCDLITKTWDAEKHLISPVCAVVSMLKGTLAPSDTATIERICDKFGIETNGSLERIAELAQKALEMSNSNLKKIDFDDMLYLVWKFNIACKKFDFILADEWQDANEAQRQLLLKSIKETTRIIVVGDRKQSMYGFRGAAIDSMDKTQQVLNALELPLSITYRCPRSHVRLVNQLFPNIPFEAAPNAEEGAINFCSKEKMLGQVQDGDLVLSRVNAALVGPVFALIRRGIKAIIRGRDIGQGLLTLINKFEERAEKRAFELRQQSVKAEAAEVLVELLEDYKEKEVARLLAKKKATQAENLADRVETIIAIAEDADSIAEMKSKIEEVFTDKKVGVIFSTVHRAKGDEAENVYILRPDLMPHPMAAQAWEQEQELNILYVALTRSKRNLTFIGQIPSLPDSVEVDRVEYTDKEELVEFENARNEKMAEEFVLPLKDEVEDLSKVQEELLASALVHSSNGTEKKISDCPF